MDWASAHLQGLQISNWALPYRKATKRLLQVISLEDYLLQSMQLIPLRDGNEEEGELL